MEMLYQPIWIEQACLHLRERRHINTVWFSSICLGSWSYLPLDSSTDVPTIFQSFRHILSALDLGFDYDDDNEFDEYNRSKTISAQLGRALRKSSSSLCSFLGRKGRQLSEVSETKEVFNQHPHSCFALHRYQMTMTGIWVIKRAMVVRWWEFKVALSYLQGRLRWPFCLQVPRNTKWDPSWRKWVLRFSGWDESRSWCLLAMFKSAIILLLSLPLICSFVVIRLLNPSLIFSLAYLAPCFILYPSLSLSTSHGPINTILILGTWFILPRSFPSPDYQWQCLCLLGLLVMETGFSKEPDCGTQRT